MGEQTPEKKISFRVEVPGADEAAREFEKVTTSLGKAGKQANDNDVRFKAFTKELDAAKKASESLRGAADKQSDAFGRLSQNTSRGAQVLTAFTGALGSAVPGLDTVASTLGRTSGAMSAMSGILGGAAGIATGGILFAVGTLATQLVKVVAETNSLAKATNEYNTSLEDQLELLLKLDKATAYRQQLGLGVLSLNQTLAEARVKEARQTYLRTELAGAARTEGGGLVDPKGFERLTKEYWQVESELKTLRADITRIKAEDAAFASQDAKAEIDELRGKGDRLSTKYQAPDQFTPTSAGQKEWARTQGAIEAQKQALQERQGALEEAKKAAQDLDKTSEQLHQIEVERQKARVAASIELKREEREADIRGARETDRKLAEIERQREARNRLFRESGVETMKAVGTEGVQALAALARGEKVTGAQILAGIGNQLVAKGSFYLFEGLARAIASFGADPSATGLIGLGTAEIAAGMGLGAAVRGGAPGGGGGGAAAPRAVYYTQNADGSYSQSAIEPAARPSTSTSGASQVINVSMPAVVAPGVSDWKRIEAARNEARRQGA